MKACLVIPSVYCYFAHAVALNLKREHDVNEFCAYVFSPWAEDFIKNRTDIKYDPILVDHKIHAQTKTEKIDIEYLKYFEKTFSPPNAWLTLYQDRKLMMSMGPKEDSTLTIDPLYNQDGLMKAYQVRAKTIEKMLREAKPDFVLFSFIGNISQLLIAQIAKKLGIKTLSLEFCKIGNRMDVTADHFTITGLEREMGEIKTGGEGNIHCVEAKKIIDNFKKTGSLKLDYIEEYKKLIAQKESTPILLKRWETLKYFFVHWKNYLKYKNLFLYYDTTVNPFRFFYQKIRRDFRKRRGLKDLYSTPNYQEDYVFYPLHYEPELSIQTLSPFYFDQLTLLRYISRSLPLHFKIYVKDHPQTTFNRPKSYFKEILKIPNVRLIDHNVSSFDIINKAKMVFTITGTAGFEAALLGKPVITFGDIFYNILTGVTRIREIEKLPTIVDDLLNNFKSDEKNINSFVAAILKDSVNINFSALRSECDLEKLKNDESLKQFCNLVMRKAK